MKITAGRDLLCLFNNKTLILSSVETRQTHTQKGGVNIRKKDTVKICITHNFKEKMYKKLWAWRTTILVYFNSISNVNQQHLRNVNFIEKVLMINRLMLHLNPHYSCENILYLYKVAYLELRLSPKLKQLTVLYRLSLHKNMKI